MSVLRAYAALRHVPQDVSLLDRLGEEIAHHAGTLRPQGTTNTLWAYATLGYAAARANLRTDGGKRLFITSYDAV